MRKRTFGFALCAMLLALCPSDRSATVKGAIASVLFFPGGRIVRDS